MLGHRLFRLFALLVVPLATIGRHSQFASARSVAASKGESNRVKLTRKTLEISIYS